jgi:restriction endonuclease S subunit
MSKTATMTTIGQKEILKSPIILPSIELQKEFILKIQKIEEQKTLYQEELKKLQENFDSLLAQSFKA